jgi:hypothetical protein
MVIRSTSGARRVRGAFRSSALWFASVVDDVGSGSWSGAGLGVWTLRELVGHCSINCTMILELLEPSGAPRPLAGRLTFWRGVLAGSRSDTHAAIARSALSAADELGVEPAVALRDRNTVGYVASTVCRIDRCSERSQRPTLFDATPV